MPVQQVPNSDLGRDTARQNLLTNGGFEVWQRGNGPFTGSVYSADRWTVLLGGTSTASVSRDAVNADGGGGYCLAAAYTHNASSNLYQPSTDSVAQLRGRAVTFSIRVKTSTANAVRPICSDGVVASNGPYHSGSGQYETLTITKVMSGSSTLVNTGVSLDASCTAYIDNATLVFGNVAADYAPLHPADDLARCLRYYEIVGGNGSSPIIRGIATATGQPGGFNWFYSAKKAASPTVTKVGTWNLTNAQGQPVVNSGDTSVIELYANSAAAGPWSVFSGAGMYLTAEANP